MNKDTETLARMLEALATQRIGDVPVIDIKMAQHEVFSFESDGVSYMWDVTIALELIEAGTLDGYRYLVWLDEIPESLNVKVDPAHVERVTLQRLMQPLLFVTMHDGSVLPIDGWHRIAKARSMRLPVLPAFIATDDSGFRLI